MFEPFKKFATFNGRSRRKEYWLFFLFNMVVVLIIALVESSLNAGEVKRTASLADLYNLIVLIPSIAVGVRRMHDVGKSGWFILVPIYSLVLLVTDGMTGKNKYGYDPKDRDVYNGEESAGKNTFRWKCPKCSTINPNTTYTCTQCDYILR
jgi:uncharacterized membrane protein YhaH (DUF805 family)